MRYEQRCFHICLRTAEDSRSCDRKPGLRHHVCRFPDGVSLGVPAALLGHLALERIRESGGTYAGERMAKVGLTLGYGASIASILIWVTWLLAAW